MKANETCYWVELDGSWCGREAVEELDRPYCAPHAEAMNQTCEHGLDWQLCAGPMHYPADH